jgi:putative flippase GtrA
MVNLNRLVKYKQFLKYFSFGLILNIIAFVLFIIFTSFYNITPFKVILFLHPLIVIIYFFSQIYYVFEIKKIEIRFIIKFGLMFFLKYFLNLSLIFLATEIFNFNHIFSQLIIVFLLSFLTFIINKKIIFI